MPEPILSFRDVSVQFSEVPVLNRLNLDFEPGRSVAILGRSGSGKTTLLKTALGLFSPRAGEVKFHGKDTREPEVRSELRAASAMAFQKSGLFDSMRCGENLNFVMLQRTKFSRAERDRRIAKALEEVGLSGQEQLQLSEMSGGMQKRLGVARALLLDPKLVLFDEPTAGLDPVTTRSIDQLLLDAVARAGATMVAVCSDPVEAYRLCDWIGFLHHGKILAFAPRAEIKNSKDPAVRQFLDGAIEGPLADRESDEESHD